jgi:hypothetical protein
MQLSDRNSYRHIVTRRKKKEIPEGKAVYFESHNYNGRVKIQVMQYVPRFYVLFLPKT